MTEEKNSVETLDRQRRKTLVALSGLIGAAASNHLLSGNGFGVAVAYANTDPKELTPKIFKAAQLETLKNICQTVIPKTDTAGAGDVDTHGFIDNQLHHCFDADAQDAIIKVVNKIEKRAQRRHKQSFSELNDEQAQALLSDIDLCKKGFKEKDTDRFKFLKSLIVFGYYTSEVGATQELTYDPVPGGFKGRIPLEDMGSAWGSLAYF